MAYSLLLDGARVPCNSAAVRDFLSEKTVTASMTGTGLLGATVLVQGSDDGAVWQPLGSVTMSGTDSASGSATVSSTMEYTRARLDAVSGDGAAVTVSLEAQSAAEKASDLPAGGTTGQGLVKASDADGDVTWGDVGVPAPPESGRATLQSVNGTQTWDDGTNSVTHGVSDGTDGAAFGLYNGLSAGGFHVRSLLAGTGITLAVSGDGGSIVISLT